MTMAVCLNNPPYIERVLFHAHDYLLNVPLGNKPDEAHGDLLVASYSLAGNYFLSQCLWKGHWSKQTRVSNNPP